MAGQAGWVVDHEVVSRVDGSATFELVEIAADFDHDGPHARRPTEVSEWDIGPSEWRVGPDIPGVRSECLEGSGLEIRRSVERIGTATDVRPVRPVRIRIELIWERAIRKLDLLHESEAVTHASSRRAANRRGH